MKKLFAAIALSGVLSVSALAMTAQAAESSTVCCTRPRFVDFSETYYGNPGKDYHDVYKRTGIRCQHCGYSETLTDDFWGLEEHDYDIYDLDNHVRYCKCGDAMF